MGKEVHSYVDVVTWEGGGRGERGKGGNSNYSTPQVDDLHNTYLSGYIRTYIVILEWVQRKSAL